VETETVTFNACDWTGTMHTVKYRTLDNGNIKFKFQDEDFSVTFTKDEEEGLYCHTMGKVHAKGWKYPLANVVKWGSDKFWTASEMDQTYGISREHDNPVAAICQLLSNIL